MISEYDIEYLFQDQLDRIEDADLRQKVVNIWVDACAKGNWDNSDQLLNMPFTLLTKTHGINFIEHTIVVTEGALGIAKAMLETCKNLPYRIDMDRLVAGGLLHDVGKLLEIEPISGGGYRKSRSGMCARHPISGAILVAEAGLSEEMVNIVACHAKEGDGRPQVIETVLIHQADFATFNPLVMMEKGHLIL